MHVILVDNGRSDMIANKEHWMTLKCIRCAVLDSLAYQGQLQ